ncbi:adenylosuccinate synthase [Blattabacterium cuenoti]|uniref:adenylosuccinate synthase n=1 Tax=Blattabacterium cuenoti TaxID=1653831 RepID=UPI00163CBB70|nr:adenylosuccinate synthase [Blattabacterium cuenoti]
MPSNVIVGLQWGDEGKGKITDLLSKNSDYVIRYQGGNNSGHSIHVKNRYFVLHLIPSGVIYPNVTCIVGAGVVIDPKSFIQEIKNLESIGIDVSKVFIEHRAHITMPYHLLIDQYREESLGKKAIGTTHRGIGPTYEDKIARIGIRALDLLDKKNLYKKIQYNVHLNNALITKIYKKPPLSFEEIYHEYEEYANLLYKRIIDSIYRIHRAFQEKKNLLFEGAQAMLLDINYGTYPYVTPSSTTTGGVCTGSGIPPNFLENFIGISKAYCTRVGNGPFPTEIFNQNVNNHIQKKGNEYGSTTQRIRRCGWLDLVALKYSCMINGINCLIVTKLDILSGLNVLKICVKYKIHHKIFKNFPSDMQGKKIECIFLEFPGWKEDISFIKEYDHLPKNCKNYVEYIEKYLQLKIVLISVGSERNQNIIKNNQLFNKIFS